MPLLPTTAADVSLRIVGTRYETCNGQPFFRGSVNSTDEGISCIFASDAQLDLLSTSSELHVDASYKTVPRQFYQLFTVFVTRQDFLFFLSVLY